ncbi:hypothetical protein EDB87DRAFT_749395 [Lactarius vividus]|nr:hypothetical protein EDB87DRAFT_749395 [Lactarius vividus]
MGSCSSKPTAVMSNEMIVPQGVGTPGPSFQRSCTKPGLPTLQVPPPKRPTHARVRSMRAQCMKGDENYLPPPPKRFRTKSLVTPSGRNLSSDHGQMSAGTSRGRPTASYPARRLLKSTVWQVLPGHFKFRILVVGKSRSGKSSLIRAVFQVDATAEPKDTHVKADINVEFHPEDNRYLIAHECSGLESQPGDSQNLQTIRDFISHRTDASRSPLERLHAVWICVPASDAINGEFGKGVEDILNMRTGEHI